MIVYAQGDITKLGCGTGGLDRKTVQNLLAHNLISDFAVDKYFLFNLKSSRSDGSERLFFVVLKTCKFADFDI